MYIFIYMSVPIYARSPYEYGHHHTDMGPHNNMVIFLTLYKYH